MSITINDVRSMADPQRSYKWRVTFRNFSYPKPEEAENQLFGVSQSQLSNLANSVRSSATRLGSEIESNMNSITGAKSNRPNSANVKINYNPSIYVEEVQGLSLPNIDREAFYEGGRETYYPALEIASPVTMSFYQSSKSEILEYMSAWKRKVINPDGTKNLPKLYKETVRIELLNGYNNPVYEFELTGCFPTLTQGYALNNASENLKLVQEFSVDRIFVKSVQQDNPNSNNPNLLDRLDSLTAQEIQKKGTIVTNTVQKANSLGDFL